MFNNSISVLSGISRSIKKYVFVLSIITQILFVAYYIYLMVTHYQKIHLLILYTALTSFAIVVLLIDIFTYDIEDTKSKLIKIKAKKIMNALSWLFKAGVIGYNIFVTVTSDVTEASKMFLIFSGVFLIIQVSASLIGWLFAYYSELLVYAFKMDYENLVDEKDDPSQKPIGQALNKFTNDKNHKDKVNELVIKYELHGSIKDEIKKEGSIRFNGRVIKKEKAKKIVLKYYKKAKKYYTSPKKMAALLDEIDERFFDIINRNDKAFLLDFFLINAYEQAYVGLSEHAVKLIIGGFLFMLDDNSKDIIYVIYKALIKEIIDFKSWYVVNKPLSTTSELYPKVDRAVKIAKDTKEQYELYKDETIGSELESLIVKVVKDAAIENGRLMIKKKIRKLFRID